MKKAYSKPSIETEKVFETLAAGCGFDSTTIDQCFPDYGGTLNTSL